MSFYSEQPCGQRAANGIECARRYGRDVAEKKKRVPTRKEVAAHVEFHKFTDVWAEEQYKAAITSALKHLWQDLKHWNGTLHRAFDRLGFHACSYTPDFMALEVVARGTFERFNVRGTDAMEMLRQVEELWRTNEKEILRHTGGVDLRKCNDGCPIMFPCQIARSTTTHAGIVGKHCKV